MCKARIAWNNRGPRGRAKTGARAGTLLGVQAGSDSVMARRLSDRSMLIMELKLYNI